MKVDRQVLHAREFADAAWSAERLAWSKLNADPSTLITWWEAQQVAKVAQERFDQAIAGFMRAKRVY